MESQTQERIASLASSPTHCIGLERLGSWLGGMCTVCMCVWVCVCVCVYLEAASWGERERECVCVCVCVELSNINVELSKI